MSSPGPKEQKIIVKKYSGMGGSGFEFFVAQKINRMSADSPRTAECVFRRNKKDVYIVALASGPDEKPATVLRLEEVAGNIKSFAAFAGTNIDVAILPSYDSGGDTTELTLKTLSLLYSRMASGPVADFLPLVVVSTITAVFSEDRFITVRDFEKNSALLRRGGKFPDKNVGAFFEKLGYSRDDYVRERGSYSVRGQVVDFWNPAESLPRRVVLDGEFVEEVKFFDPATQLSVGNNDNRSSCEEKHLPDNVILSPAYCLADAGDNFLKGWFSHDVINDGGDERGGGGAVSPPAAGEVFLRGFFAVVNDIDGDLPEGLSQLLPPFCQVFVNAPFAGAGDHSDEESPTEPLPFYGGNISLLERDISSKKPHIKEKIFFYSSDGELQRFNAVCPAEITFEKSFKAHISEGFFNRKKGLLVLAARQFFLKSAPPAPPPFLKLKIPSQRLENLWEIREGDYVVHEKYGIGVYRGITLMDDPPQEFIVVEYKHNDRIYVPVWDFGRIKKYIGVEGVKPSLSDLDAPGLWERARKNAARSAEIFAKELLKLYAERESASAPRMTETTVWEEELAESFPFDETPDQATAIKETLADLERPRPAERLVLGDVGFGKTEVAIRAAFKAAVNSYQTAVLVPTTILAMQHYSRFQERLAPFPAVRVVVLHRFLSPSEKKKVLSEISSGAADIVIGTHRLLSRDVHFKKLGLLIIDEEHRFGVRHKEKLRRVSRGVHTIYMSATPIPRTLASALEGLKDISLIETPPVGRKPVATFVLPYSADKIRYAILRELSRGGQIFYVKNFISELPRALREVSSISKTARWGMIHGKMKPAEIENTLYEFYRGALDGVVATTIIEAGLDIPQVNTMIIEGAQDFGLAQLYQLRGRVGRGDREAYCYLFYDDKNLTEDAVKRIEALKIFSYGLGQGFELARRDMEIRGAGAAFGYRQHGFLASVGFEYYSRLIAGAVRNLSGRASGSLSDDDKRKIFSLKEDPVISIPHTSAYIPPDYVTDDVARISFYRKFLNVSSAKDIEDIKNELADRFGKPIPAPVLKLSDVAALRLMMKDKGITAVRWDESDGGGLVVEFSEDSAVYFDEKNLRRLFAAFEGRLSFASSRGAGSGGVSLKDAGHSGSAFAIKNLPKEIIRNDDLPSVVIGLLEKILEFATIRNHSE